MDAKKFGMFIATLRKEKNMTQVDLAKKLQVTDKAVSKWERGLGFPDINSIEPLADALGVSVLEIMRSEKIEETAITQDTASAALTDTFELVKLQRKAERKSIAKIAGCVAAILFLVFLIDGMGWMAGRKILCKRFSTKSRMALESRADSGLDPLITESHGGQNGMRAGAA